MKRKNPSTSQEKEKVSSPPPLLRLLKIFSDDFRVSLIIKKELQRNFVTIVPVVSEIVYKTTTEVTQKK